MSRFRMKNNPKREPKDLNMVLLEWGDYQIIKYIREYFDYKSDKDKKAELQRIRGLDMDTLILGIARIKEIEEFYDNSKTVPGFVAVSVFMVSQIMNLYTDDESLKLFGLVVAYSTFIVLLFSIKRGSSNRSRAVKYRSLLEQVKSEMEKAS
ncbi:hypothetical protein L3137_15570 [Bacillus sonorensis]|uniref:hypothetical protein n=1 Tax=Bacillus sonorensis TaxID=119858 RepID=UPI001F250F3E|nr:hypothetical protein [Bacillus sonorensis]MCF7618676.1 hypothetical protein [Bacillus sonorensis]